MKNYNMEMLDAMQTKKVKDAARDLLMAMREVFEAHGMEDEGDAAFAKDDTSRAFAEVAWNLCKMADGNGHEVVDQYEQLCRNYAELKRLQGAQ